MFRKKITSTIGNGSIEGPRGAIPRYQHCERHIEFFKGNPVIDTVMVDITALKSLVGDELTADTHFPGVSVITTTTVNDAFLNRLGWDQELDLVLRFQPEFHIPCDYSVYEDQPPEKRGKIIEEYLEALSWFSDALECTAIRLLPQVKGITYDERKLCYTTFAELDFTYITYYGSQYFGRHVGNRGKELIHDVRDIVSEFYPCRLLLIGCTSPKILRKLPPRVVATAGQRWRDASQLGECSMQESKDLFDDWKAKADEELGVGTPPLSIFGANNTAEGTTYGH